MDKKPEAEMASIPVRAEPARSSGQPTDLPVMAPPVAFVAEGSAPAGTPATAGESRPAARRAARGGLAAGLISAVAVVVITGAVVTYGSLTPAPMDARQLSPVLTAVPAGASTGVCPGPARLLEGTATGTDPEFSAASSSAKTSVSAAVVGNPGAQLPASRLQELDGSEPVSFTNGAATAAPAAAEVRAGVIAGQGVDGIRILQAEAQEGQEASAAGLSTYSANDGDLSGTAAASCQEPANDLWLAGATTTVGRTAVLVVTNPSSNPATVNLELFGGAGQIQAPGSRGLLVAPGTSRSIVLAGLAPGEEQLSVHLRSAGGPVAAVIQQSVLRGLVPGGVDYISPSTGPGVRQVMTGVDIQDPAAVAALTATRGFGDAGPALSITVPGTTDAVVEIKLFGQSGQQALPKGGVVTAKAGSLTQVPLAGLPAGQYTVLAESDVAFTATTRVARGTDSTKRSDLAWSPSSARLGSQHIVPVPANGSRTMVFGALDARATISYTPVTANGALQPSATLDIAGGTTGSVKVPESIGGSAVNAYVVSAAGDSVYGALLLTGADNDDVSVVNLTPSAAGQEKVPVTLGY